MKKSMFIMLVSLLVGLSVLLAACAPAAALQLPKPLPPKPLRSSQSWFADGIRQSCGTVLQ